MKKGIEGHIKTNIFIHKYIISLNHAFLWIAALNLAGFFHISPWFDRKEALLCSTLVAYSAYLCESGLGVWRVSARQSLYFINYRKASLWKYVWLNFFINAGFAVVFIFYPSWIFLLAIIFTAGWQKYMDGVIPSRLEETMMPVTGQVFKEVAI